MDTGYMMSFASKRDYLRRIYARLPGSVRRAEERILDESGANCNYHRKYAIRLLTVRPRLGDPWRNGADAETSRTVCGCCRF